MSGEDFCTYSLEKIGGKTLLAREGTIDKRYYHIVPGKEDDPRWDTYPHYELYPSAKLGDLKYELG